MRLGDEVMRESTEACERMRNRAVVSGAIFRPVETVISC